MAEKSYRTNGANLARFADIVALLVKLPRTVSELREAAHITNPDQAYRYIEVLRNEGLLYIKEWPRCGTRHAARYAWQPGVHEMPDAPKPIAECKETLPGKRELARMRKAEALAELAIATARTGAAA